MEQTNRIEKRQYAILFLLGIFLLFLRSAYTVTVPSLYAEEGTWISFILNHGFVHTLFGARGDYLVSGNILLLGVALTINRIFCGDNLTYLPQFVTLVQYCFFSLFALLPVICFKKTVRKKFRILMWFLVLTVPLGTSGMEVLGKIVNVGFVAYDIAFLLLFYKVQSRNELTKIQLALVDIVLLVCCATNPGSYLLVGAAFFVDIALQLRTMETGTFYEKVRLLLRKYYNLEWIVLGVLCAALAGFDLFVLTVDQYQGANATLTADTPISVELIARFFLFYITYPFYTHLNDGICIAIFAILIGANLLVFFSKKISSEQKFWYAVILCAVLVYFATTLVARVGLLAPLLNDYSSSYVDRYYYGINIISMIALVYMLNLMTNFLGRMSQLFAIALAALLTVNPFWKNSHIFEYDRETTGWSHVVPFTQRLKEAVYNPETGLYTVGIDPEGAKIEMGEKYIVASLQNKRKAEPLVVANFSDINWSSGVGTAEGLENRLLFTWESRDFLKLCDTLTVGNQQVKVLDVVDYGQWVHVVCDTTELENFAYPSEIAFTLKGDIKQ